MVGGACILRAVRAILKGGCTLHTVCFVHFIDVNWTDREHDLDHDIQSAHKPERRARRATFRSVAASQSQALTCEIAILLQSPRDSTCQLTKRSNWFDKNS
jgi:hypothetical protein